jgi:hypothetical protein
MEREKRQWKYNIQLDLTGIGWEGDKIRCDLNRKEGGENFIMRNSMTRTRHEI